jgi:hypothetical protein
MAHFQLGHSTLFPGGTKKLLLKTSAGTEEERMVIHTGNKFTLELAEWDAASGNPKIHASKAGVLTISEPKKSGNKWVFTIKADGAADTTELTARGSAGADLTTKLKVIAGEFKSHGDWASDLIAAVFRGSDPAKMHAIARVLSNYPDNLFNEKSTANERQWGELACGTVAKVGGRKLFFPSLKYSYRQYHKTIPNVATAAQRAALKREDVKYKEATLKKGLEMIQKRLMKKWPIVVGLTYRPSWSVQSGGWLKPTDGGGHSVLIVACNDTADKFIYFDPYPKGSKLKYAGGPAGTNAFPVACEFLGLFEAKHDATRGSKVLRQDPATQISGEIFDGDQFLEVVSGPLDESSSTEKD